MHDFCVFFVNGHEGHHQTSRLTIYFDVSRILGDVCKGFLAAEQYRPKIIHMQVSHLVKMAQWPGVMCRPVPWLGQAGACKNMEGYGPRILQSNKYIK